MMDYLLRLFLLVLIAGLAMILISIVFLILLVQLMKKYAGRRKKARRKADDELSVGFFHPYCNAGGGGERVLWCAVRALLNEHPNVRCVIYTGDCEATPEEILAGAKKMFNITLPKKVEFIFLKKREWVEASHYPFFTLLWQSLGSMWLGYEAFKSFVPDVFIDTMGYAFTFFIFKHLGGCKVGCYVHYPTISTDMLSVVSDRTGSFNNRTLIANSKVLTNFKLFYYRLFASLYGYAGSKADVVMVNSSWTKSHIEKLWGSARGKQISKIFPPCDIKEFLELPLERSSEKTVLSIGQFRPEKNHALQVKSFAHFLSSIPEDQRQQTQLVMAGGCRNEGDRRRVKELESLTGQLGVSKYVKIRTNIPFSELKHLLSTSHVGIHTMTNEHFGIGVVEFQAAGVIALAHDSGGPKMDIVVSHDKNKTGYLAEDVESYSDALKSIFQLSSSERNAMARVARKSCERFSESHFEKDFLQAVQSLLQ